MVDLHEIARRLRAELKTDAEFSFLNTRVILRTGVDLLRIDERRNNADRSQRVLQVLHEMGFLGGGR